MMSASSKMRTIEDDLSPTTERVTKKSTRGTVKPKENFDPAKDVKELRDAMKGIGTDVKIIIDIVGSRSNAQRQEIATLFQATYGRDLVEDLKSEIRGYFAQTVTSLFYSPIEYDVICLHKALSGMVTDEETLIEIVFSRSKDEMEKIKSAYELKYDLALENHIGNDGNGPLRRILRQLVQNPRDENVDIDEDLVKSDATALHQSEPKRMWQYGPTFNNILCSKSFPHLRETFLEYRNLAKRDIMKSIESQFSGEMEAGMKAIVELSYYQPAYFAKRLYRSMKGLGTHDSILIRVIVTRCGVDMEEIKVEFENTYGKSLGNFIEGDTSGDYMKMLLFLCRE